MSGSTVPLFLATLCLTGLLADDKPNDKPAIRVEFRRAEEKPGDGLTEATAPLLKDKIYLHKTADLTNEDIAEVKRGENEFGPTLWFTFTQAGAKKMATLSTEHRDKRLAILVDGKVICAPLILAVLSDKAEISGDFTKEQIDKWVSTFKGPRK
jgi:preprotein translocase subunit SecD